jgi:GTPase SAR1 family protein
LGALLVYDVTRKETFVAVQRFLYDLRQNAEPDCVVYLVGNKVDLVNDNESARQVSIDEAKQFANENRLYFIETSAYSNYKVTEAFENLLEGN